MRMITERRIVMAVAVMRMVIMTIMQCQTIYMQMLHMVAITMMRIMRKMMVLPLHMKARW